MKALFFKLLTVSITASWLVFAVMILRILFRKAPKSIRCMLWAFVSIRLIFPFSLESEWSLIPDTEFMLSGILQTETAWPETLHTGTGQPEANVIETNAMETNAAETARLNEAQTNTAPKNTTQAEPVPPESWDVHFPDVPLLNDILRVLLSAVSVLWLPGFFLLFAYALISFLHIRKRTEEAVHLKDRVWICDRIPSTIRKQTPITHSTTTVITNTSTYRNNTPVKTEPSPLYTPQKASPTAPRKMKNASQS